MGIQLDWEVEAEGGWEEIGEDPEAARARRRRNRRLRNGLLVLLALAALVSGAVAARLRQVKKQVRAELESTVAAETLALRIGDRSSYLRLQSEIGEWQRIQGDRFDEYQSLGERVAPNGEIVDLAIDGESARVVLRERIDGQPYLVTWFYERDETGWRHVPPAADAWGQAIQAASTYFDYGFPEADRALAEALMPVLDSWWTTACHLMGCQGTELPRPRIEIVPDPLTEIGWADYDPWTLLIPSPSLRRVPEGGYRLDTELTAALADLIASRWAHVMLTQGRDNISPASDLAWAERELALWLRHELDPSAPPSEFVASLAEAYGPDLGTSLVQAIRYHDRLIPALQSLTDVPVAELPVSWNSYLAHRLQAETRLVAEGYVTEAGLLFRDLDAMQGSEPVLDFPVEQHARPDSIAVIGVWPVHNGVLTGVRFEQVGSLPGEMVTVEPFRLTSDGWVHTRMAADFWGAEYEEQSEHFELHYYELDASTVEGLLPYLESVYAYLARVLVLPPNQPAPDTSPDTTPFLVFVSPYTQEAFLSSQPPVIVEAYASVLRVPSPYGIALPADVTMQSYAQASTAWELVKALITRQVSPVPADNQVTVAFIGWAMAQIGVDYAALPGPAQEMLADSLATQVLLDLLVELYGPDAIPLLLENLPGSSSVDEWLARSLGVEDISTVREAWQGCLADDPVCPLDY